MFNNRKASIKIKMRKSTNRISTSMLIFLDILISLVYYPGLVVVLGPFFLYRLWVILLAKLIDRSLIPMSRNDNLVAWDLLTAEPQRRPLVFSVGCALHIEGILSLEEVQKKYSRVLLEPVKKDGRPVHEKMFQVVKLFGGYAFRKYVSKLDIDTKFRSVEPKNGKSLADFTKNWMMEYYAENSPPWEVAVVPVKDAEQTFILFKWHHTILDGLNVVHFMNTFTDSKTPMPPTELEDSIAVKILQGIHAPRKIAIELYTIWKSKSAFSSLKIWNDYCPDFLASKVRLYYSDIKLIQRKTGARVTSVNLALLTAVLARLLRERQGNDYVHMAIPLPMPNHPIQKMCNHWVGGTLDLPLKSASTLDRVKQTERIFREYQDAGIDKIWFRFIFPLASILPLRLYQYTIEFARKTCGLRVLCSTMVSFAEGFYEVEGRPVISMQPLFGLYGTVSGAWFCYQDQCEFVLNVTPELAISQDHLDSVLQNYLVEEVDNLVRQLTKS